MSDIDITKFASEGNRDLHILFGSQSGNSEGLAEKWQKEAPRYGLIPTVHDMDGFDIKSMSEMTRVMIVCSTWGEGEMPDNAEELYQEALDAGSILSKTNFSVCSLGDTGYDLFCQSGKDWDKTLQDMGGARIYDRVDCDVDYEMPAEEWMKGVMPKLACVGDDGTFVPELEEKMVAYASGVEIDEPEEKVEAVGGTTAYQAMATVPLFFKKPNKWLKRVKGVLAEDELPTTGIEKAKEMFKELRKVTLKSLPQGRDYIALVDMTRCKDDIRISIIPSEIFYNNGTFGRYKDKLKERFTWSGSFNESDNIVPDNTQMFLDYEIQWSESNGS